MKKNLYKKNQAMLDNAKEATKLAIEIFYSYKSCSEEDYETLVKYNFFTRNMCARICGKKYLNLQDRCSINPTCLKKLLNFITDLEKIPDSVNVKDNRRLTSLYVKFYSPYMKLRTSWVVENLMPNISAQNFTSALKRYNNKISIVTEKVQKNIKQSDEELKDKIDYAYEIISRIETEYVSLRKVLSEVVVQQNERSRMLVAESLTYIGVDNK